jgi:hypothetical protein
MVSVAVVVIVPDVNVAVVGALSKRLEAFAG